MLDNFEVDRNDVPLLGERYVERQRLDSLVTKHHLDARFGRRRYPWRILGSSTAYITSTMRFVTR